MNPQEYIKSARILAEHGRRPTQISLRRATSTAYYALFHTVSRCCADALVGGNGSDRSKPAWRQVYRALEHGGCKSACQNKALIDRFPKPIEDFANAFVTMQIKRHNADYDPYGNYTKSEVITDIDNCEQAIKDFQGVPMKDRRAFSALVLFKHRP